MTDAPAPTLGATTQRDAVTHSIRRAIVAGALAPGEKLREVALAAEFGVSRPTLREALNGLVQSGMLTHQPYRGYGVASLDAATLRDLASTRVTLDMVAIRAIRSDPTGGRIEQLLTAWNAAAHRILDEDPLVQHDAHVAFHHSVWEASGNQMLVRLWPVVESSMTIALAQDQAASADPLRAYRLHAALVDTIVTGELDEIEVCLVAHIVDGAERLIATASDRIGDPREFV